MTAGTSDRPIFHITHLSNLPSILAEGGLWSDAEAQKKVPGHQRIGYAHIKGRRLGRAVTVAAGGCLGDYVPFNFCPRSVMLYVIHRGHDDYDGGQEEVLHLVSSVKTAASLGRPFAFTDRHAELGYALYYDSLDDLAEVPWSVMRNRYWQEVREERQAEFLVHDFVPWTGITSIGVQSKRVAAQVETMLAVAAHAPAVRVTPEWYY